MREQWLARHVVFVLAHACADRVQRRGSITRMDSDRQEHRLECYPGRDATGGWKTGGHSCGISPSLAKMRNGGRKPGGFCTTVHILPAPRDCGAVCDINFCNFITGGFAGARSAGEPHFTRVKSLCGFTRLLLFFFSGSLTSLSMTLHSSNTATLGFVHHGLLKPG